MQAENEKELMPYYGIGKHISQNSRDGLWGKGAIDSVGERLMRSGNGRAYR